MTTDLLKRFLSLDRLFDFKGRATRLEYWTTGIFLSILLVAGTLFGLTFASYAISEPDGARFPITWPLIFIGPVITAVPTAALQVRRYHDRDKPAWWLLVALIPYFGSLWMFIELGFFRGTNGVNRYGLALQST